MSQTDLASRPAPPSVWHMYRAMVGVGVICGLLIVTAFQVTLPIIERNKAEYTRRMVRLAELPMMTRLSMSTVAGSSSASSSSRLTTRPGR